MPPAIIAAGVGAAASIGGGLLASSGTKSAAKTASDAASQTADKNNALQRETRDINIGLAAPWMQSGLQANNAINSLLGLNDNHAPQAPQAGPQSNYTAGGYSAPANAFSGVYGDPSGMGTTPEGRMALIASGDDMYQMPGSHPAVYNPPAINQSDGYAQQGATTPAGPTASPYQNAFNQYLNSTGYQFRVGQGMDGINNGYAARGLIQSGAAMKAMDDYRQGMASNEFGKYMGYLGNQQGVGLSATNATMGVGTNYANSVSANNNSAGSAIGNAALASGQANANMWGGVAQGVGNAFGQLGSSYGGGGGGNAGYGSLPPGFGPNGGGDGFNKWG